MKIAAIMVAFACGSALAAETTTNVELRMVRAAIQPAIERLEPAARVEYADTGESLVVTYRAQSYKIHGRSMTGEISTNAYDEIGPSVRGFVLHASLQNAGEINQACTPQTLREPYWQTDLDVTPIRKTGKQVFWALSYGVRTDTNVLMQIRAALGSLKP